MSTSPQPPPRDRRSVQLPASPPASNTVPATTAGPAPERLAAVLARAWIEVRVGRRSIAQLLPFVAPAVRRRLVAQLPGPGQRPPSTARVHRVIAHRPTSDACEATVLIEQAGRITALAIRLERHRGVWRAVELTAPEAGLAPLTTRSVRPLPDLDELVDDAFGVAAARHLTG